MVGTRNLYARLEAPAALKYVGLAESDVDEAAGLILPHIPTSNPRTDTAGNLTQLLRAAWAGAVPAR